MRILDKYISKEFTKRFIATVMFFICIIFAVDTIEIARDTKELGVLSVVQISGYRTLYVLSYIFDVVILISVFFTFSKFNSSSELVAMRSLRYSQFRVLAPVCILISIFAVLYQNYFHNLSVWAYKQAERIRLEKDGAEAGKRTLWLKQSNQNGGYIFINFAQIDNEDMIDSETFMPKSVILQGVIMANVSSKFKLLSYLSAESAILLQNSWKLKNVKTYSLDGSTINKADRRQMTVPTNLSVNFVLNWIRQESLDPSIMSFKQLKSLEAELKAYNLDSDRFRPFIYVIKFKILLFLSMVLIGGYFASYNIRSGKVYINFLVAGLVAVLVFMLQNLAKTLSVASPHLSRDIIIVIYTFIALIALRLNQSHQLLA